MTAGGLVQTRQRLLVPDRCQVLRRVRNATSSASRDPQNNCAPRLKEDAGRSGTCLLVGQVVFLLGFDRLMLTVADDHRVQVMMFSLFDLSSGGPT
jgi:hypothetical protein